MRKLMTIMLLCCCGFLSAQSYHIGDLYTAPDGSQGIVFYLHPDGSGGWVVALNDVPTCCVWGPDGDIPDLPNQGTTFVQQLLYDTAGYANTVAMRNAHPDPQTAGKPNAVWQVDLEHGWYIPAPGQMSILFAQLSFINPSISAAGGEPLSSNSSVWHSRNIYWTSAEQSASEAWTISFEDYGTGGFSLMQKCPWPEPQYFGGYLLRPVRSFTYITLVHDSTLTYEWNTGSTDPSIEVSPAQTATYTVTATSEFGCSNTAQQTIVVGSGTAQTIYDTVCQGADYEANGFTLTEAETGTVGTLTRTRTLDNEDCSSTLTLQLTVNPSVAELVEATANGSYTWNGITYYESGTYTQHFTAENGCDSTVTLLLTIENLPEVSITSSANTICAGDSTVLQAVIENPELFVTPQAPPIAAGDILCTDGTIVKPSAYAASGKTALGIVFFVDSTDEHGWAMALHDLEGPPYGYLWSSSEYQSYDVPTLDNIVNSRDAIGDFDGYGNTQKLRAAGDSTQFPAAWAVDFDHGWYLPAIGQMTQFYVQLVTMNASLTVVGGTPFDWNEHHYYWSSTEAANGRAWNMVYGGSPRDDYKYATERIRCVRNF